jgi:3'-5' exoribonuclease
MQRLPTANRLAPNQSGWGFFLCTEKSIRAGRGGDYVALTLQDATGDIVGRVLDNVDRFRDEFDAGEFVKVQGRAQSFNGRLQFVIESIRRVMLGAGSQDRREGFSEDELVPSAPRPLDEMWAELQHVVARLSNPHVRALAESLVRANEARLRIWPAARAVHHAYRGGFLEHVLKMAEAGRALAGLYGADADLVVIGALVHDIGKLQELDYQAATTYTRAGNLVGHVTLGALMIDEACRSLPGFPDALRTELLHLVLSHHGAKEFGAPVEPMTVEAVILAAVDELDAELNQIRRALDEPGGDGEFTSFQSRLGRSFWKGPSK